MIPLAFGRRITPADLRAETREHERQARIAETIAVLKPGELVPTAEAALRLGLPIGSGKALDRLKDAKAAGRIESRWVPGGGYEWALVEPKP